MGLLGLHAIVHVARHHGDLLQRVQRAPDDRFHYPYAIGGINIASTVLKSDTCLVAQW